jgi:Rrf2 family nitric oxide-sensitive transcriptional repressor
MRLTAQSDYALRVLIYAGLQGGRPSRVADIAERYAISESHLTKVVWKLAQDGFLRTSKGRSGGLRLGKAPGEINLGAVLRAIEDNRALVECFGDRNACIITPSCAARRMFREALEAFFAAFDRYTLVDLLDRETGLRASLRLFPPAAALEV